MLVFGAGALTWMLHELGWDNFRSAVNGVASSFAIVLTLDLVAIGLESRALHTFMRPEARMVSYWRVAAAQISGRAVNVVTPFGALGEATKLTMLVTRAPRSRVASAIVLYNLAVLYLSVTVMVIGTPITLLLIELPGPLKVTIGIALAVLIALVVALGVIIHRGALSTLAGILRRLRIISAARLDDWRERLRDVDRHIAELQDTRAGSWRGILWVVASRLVTWTATMTFMRAAGVTLTPQLVIGVLSVGVLIAWAAAIVPLGLGLADTGNYALYHALGASGALGTFVTVLNRGRSLAVALVGFIVMAIVHTVTRVSLARMRRRLRELREQADQVETA